MEITYKDEVTRFMRWRNVRAEFSVMNSKKGDPCVGDKKKYISNNDKSNSRCRQHKIIIKTVD